MGICYLPSSQDNFGIPLSSPRSILILIVAAILLAALWLAAEYSHLSGGDSDHVILDGNLIGRLELYPLGENGELNVAFEPEGERSGELAWWQISERRDHSGYPRLDPQSSGSGLPGVSGEDEDPAYYTLDDLHDSTLRARMFFDGKYWLRDLPTPGNGYAIESWLVHVNDRVVTPLAGVSWGTETQNGQIARLYHPARIYRSRFNWRDVLARSGFGYNWTIQPISYSPTP
jgi:hypothetical protein